MASMIDDFTGKRVPRVFRKGELKIWRFWEPDIDVEARRCFTCEECDSLVDIDEMMTRHGKQVLFIKYGMIVNVRDGQDAGLEPIYYFDVVCPYCSHVFQMASRLTSIW